MSAVVDLKTRRAAIDPACIGRDAEGRTTYLYAATFEHDGVEGSLQFWAYDLTDAARTITSIARTLTLDGQLREPLA
jgi:hypothetical protein